MLKRIYGHQELGDIIQSTWQEDNGYDAHANSHHARGWDGCWTCPQRILKNILFLHEARGTGNCSSYCSSYGEGQT